MTLKPYQRANHFPGMVEICRKDFLARNFARMQKVEPDEYNFMPNTWVLPQEYGYFSSYAKKLYKQGSNTCFIQKPANGAMGHGIRLYRNANQVPSNLSNGITCVIQEYIENPLLIDGYKCDLRVYVLITSCDPLRIFMYNDGLIRLGAEKYVKPNEPEGDSVYRHLTNYAVNKYHEQYNRSDDEMSGNKRSFAFFDNYIRDVKKCDPFNVWQKIRDLIIKTITIALPYLLHSYRVCRRRTNNCYTGKMTKSNLKQTAISRSDEYSMFNESNNKSKLYSPDAKRLMTDKSNVQRLSASPPPVRTSTTKITSSKKSKGSTNYLSTPFICSNLFEILGFDILLDKNLNPWLIEVNRSPSFNSDQELDKRVKHGLLTDAFRLLNIRPSDKSRTEKQQKLNTIKRLCSQSVQTQNWMNSTHLPHSSGSTSLNSNQLTFKIFQNGSLQSISSKKSDLSFSNHPTHGSVKPIINKCQLEGSKLDWEIDCLRQQLSSIRQQLALEFYEHHNSGHLLEELKTTYLNPITEDDIFNKLSKLIKKESKLNPAINVKQQITEIWSKCVDNYGTSDEDDDTNDDTDFLANENFHFFNNKHGNNNKRSKNIIQLENNNFKPVIIAPTRSVTPIMKRKTPITIMHSKNNMYFTFTKSKPYSSSISISNQLLNKKHNVVEQLRHGLPLDKTFKSFESHSSSMRKTPKHVNRRIQIPPSSRTIHKSHEKNNDVYIMSPSFTMKNKNPYSVQSADDDDSNVQCSVEDIYSTHQCLSQSHISNKEELTNLKSIASIKLGEHEMSVLLDFDSQWNNLQLTNNNHSNEGINYQFLPKQKCFLPIIHWNCTLNDLLPSFKYTLKQSTEQQLMQYLEQFECIIQNQMNLANYYPCINILVDEMSKMTMFQSKLDQLNSRSLDKEDILHYFSVQYDNDRRNIVDQVNEIIHPMMLTCLKSLNLAQLQIKLEALGDHLLHEEITEMFTKKLMDKFIQGLRITRLLNRIKNRLLINHGYLLRSIIQLIPNVPIMTETIMALPTKLLTTEPLLTVEELCCKHFLRLCIESFILYYLKYLDEIMKTVNDDDNVMQFKEI
ncbi:unnamed protein product [Heterobilharzia americana]|nr:unnamed protein product [Heterobilharzia americana]